ncbi:Non-structural maintenance of chromosomes element 4 A [Echria macrotheca]|uniref:Non-structural maintenance of chromosomes element 4 n=1 Tax=Echria macrotheca TaxID=438768 RepID=A0AAJ0F1R5_9PEZI|nr:Non-structural maintenance of chromosomes element 4 A [Echria macrotheca]
MADSDSDEAAYSPQQRNLAVRNRNGLSRKRPSDIADDSSNTRRRTREPSPDGVDGVDLEAYDPDQSMQERREIQRTLRDLQQKLRENPDEFMQADPQALLDYFNQTDRIVKNVKQTAEAAIDARGLVIAADLGARRVQRLTSGAVGNGLDVDEFVSKCITFMSHGQGIDNDEAPELSSTQRWRRQPGRRAHESDDEDDMGDEGDMMNWAHLGRYATVTNIRRPALPGFLMGPLSIEKKARKTAQRSAPFKVSNLREVRPQELNAEDLKKSDKNDLPSICRKIYEKLKIAQEEAQDAAEREIEGGEDSDAEQEVLNRHALRSTGGIDLLKFVVNPHSFGQTVENMFYVSFLIREGSVRLQFDDNGLPAIEPVRKESSSSAAQSRHGAMRHQAIMSIDMEIWKDVIDAFNIKEPMIPHRQEEATGGPGARGWYS